MSFAQDEELRRALKKHKRLIKSLERNAKTIRELWRGGLRRQRQQRCMDCGWIGVPKAFAGHRPTLNLICAACGSSWLRNSRKIAGREARATARGGMLN